MTPFELLLQFAACLHGRESACFVTGSCAAMVYGEYRLTTDVDLVIDPRLIDAPDLRVGFPEPEYRMSLEAAHESMLRGGQFSIFHVPSGFKIDVIVPAPGPFTDSCFRRARVMEIKPARSARFSAPEDVILMKLKYFRQGGSDKHLRDIASMFKVSGETFDLAYLERWAVTLGVAEELAVVRERVRTATDFV